MDLLCAHGTWQQSFAVLDLQLNCAKADQHPAPEVPGCVLLQRSKSEMPALMAELWQSENHPLILKALQRWLPLLLTVKLPCGAHARKVQLCCIQSEHQPDGDSTLGRPAANRSRFVGRPDKRPTTRQQKFEIPERPADTIRPARDLATLTGKALANTFRPYEQSLGLQCSLGLLSYTISQAASQAFKQGTLHLHSSLRPSQPGSTQI